MGRGSEMNVLKVARGAADLVTGGVVAGALPPASAGGPLHLIPPACKRECPPLNSEQLPL